MSDLLNKASLVVIPSGYKEDTVYSVVPTDGSGDLSFTRASNGTRINSAGLVEVCPWNLVQNSENFGAPWTPNNNTVTTNSTTAPNGTTTADTFTLTASSDSSVYQAVNGESNNYTTSVYAKYVSGDKYLYFFSQLNSQGAKVWFDIQNGTVSNQVSGFTGTIENVGNGWYKCSMYNTTASVSDYIQFGISTTNSSRTLSNNSVAYFWGAQVNVGTAKPYFPTTDRLNVPRLTYQNGGGGCPSLLLEKQSTNLIEYSNCISAFAFAGTFTASATTSPEGVSNAFSFLVNAGQNGGLSFITLTTSAQSYTFSAYLKGSVNGQKVKLYGDLNGTIEEFTLTTDWVRYTKTFTGSVGAQSLYLLNGSYFSPSQNNLYYGYGFQLEVSSYATSLIPSNGSSATRVADACYKTGISSLIGQTSGSVFADFVYLGGVQAIPIELSNAASNNIINVYITSSATTQSYMFNGGSQVGFINSSHTFVQGSRYKMAIGYASNDLVLYINGAQIGSATPSSIPTLSEDYISRDKAASYLTETKYNEMVIFPTRLTNAELATLTTI